MNLADTQRAFWELATRRSGSVEAGALFESTPELAAAERISIYADMFVWRQVDALRADFPKLAAVLGDEPFYAVAEEYLRAHPSVHHDLGKLGAALPAFLAGHPCLPRPDLADLAALEWGRCEVFEEREVPTAGLDALRSLPPERIPHQALRVVPSLRVLTLRHDPLALWKAIEDGDDVPAPQPARTHVAVWRKHLVVHHAAIPAAEAQAARLAKMGATIAELCGAFAAADDPAQAAFGAIGSWFVEEWVAVPGGRNELDR
ncbi:MAG TPA: DNA-binding domain-containing protein [Myxococcales bacterium]